MNFYDKLLGGLDYILTWQQSLACLTSTFKHTPVLTHVTDILSPPDDTRPLPKFLNKKDMKTNLHALF